MSRLAAAALLVALGLGIGLWFGFNPQGHALAEQNMQRTTLYLSEARAGVDAWLRSVSPNNPEAPSTSVPQQAENSRSASEEVALRNFWDATRQLWISLLSPFELKS